MIRLTTIVAFVTLCTPRTSNAQLHAVCHDTVSVRRAGLSVALISFGAQVESSQVALRVCGFTNRYAVAVRIPHLDRERDFGPRLVVLQASPAESPQIIYASPGMWDADLPDLFAVPASGRTLLLADEGSEGTWGIAPFEVTQKSVRGLPKLSVGVPGSDGEPDGSAVPGAHGLWSGTTWMLHFDGPIVLGPNLDSGRIVIKPTERGVTFRLVRNAWLRDQ
jgi:hypothetical protein